MEEELDPVLTAPSALHAMSRRVGLPTNILLTICRVAFLTIGSNMRVLRPDRRA